MPPVPNCIEEIQHPLRIAFLAPCARSGGAEQVLLDLLTALRSQEPNLELFLFAGEEGPLVQATREIGIKAEAIPFPAPLAAFGESGSSILGQLTALWPLLVSSISYVFRLRKRLRECRPRVIHSNGLKMHLLAASSASSKIPLLWHLHDYPGGRPVSAKLLQWQGKRCHQIVGVSRSVTEDAIRLFPSGTPPVSTIYNGIDLDRFQPEGPTLDLDSLAGLSPANSGTIRVGLLGTFAKWKGHRVFLEAAAQLPTTLPIRFYIIGGPIYQTKGSQLELDDLRSVIGDLHLGDRAGVTGHLEDVPSAFRTLDVVVHASTAPEPFGLVIAQAMACAKAVIISRSGGAIELAVEGQEALFHSSGSPDDLADCILRLCSDSALRLKLGQAAQLRAQRSWGRTRMAGEFGELYRTMAARQRA